MKKFLVAMFAISFAFTVAACGPEEDNKVTTDHDATCTVATQDKDCADGEICNADGKCEAPVESKDDGVCKEGVEECDDTPKGDTACTAENADEVCDTNESCIDDICKPTEAGNSDPDPCEPNNLTGKCEAGYACSEAGTCEEIPPTPCTEATVEDDCNDGDTCVDDVCTTPAPPVCSPQALNGTCEDNKICSTEGKCMEPPVCSPQALNGTCEDDKVCSTEGECIEQQCAMDAECEFNELCMSPGLCVPQG